MGKTAPSSGIPVYNPPPAASATGVPATPALPEVPADPLADYNKQQTDRQVASLIADEQRYKKEAQARQAAPPTYTPQEQASLLGDVTRGG